MGPQSVIAPLVPHLVPTLMAAGLGAVIAVGWGVSLWQGRRLPSALAGAATLLPGLAVSIGAQLALEKGLVSVAVGMRLVAPLFVSLPATVVLFLGAAAAAREAPRRLGMGAVGLAIGLLPSFALLAAGSALDDMVFCGFRALVYAALAVLAAVACVGDRSRVGGEAASAAGIVFVAVVGTGEVGATALGELIGLLGAGGLTPDQRIEAMKVFTLTVLEPQQRWSMAAVGASVLLALFGVALNLPEGRRTAIAGLGLLMIGIWAVLWLLGVPSAAALAAAG